MPLERSPELDEKLVISLLWGGFPQGTEEIMWKGVPRTEVCGENRGVAGSGHGVSPAGLLPREYGELCMGLGGQQVSPR